jgi:hypothetical protein
MPQVQSLYSLSYATKEEFYIPMLRLGTYTDKQQQKNHSRITIKPQHQYQKNIQKNFDPKQIGFL